ncbi:unnamed protein product [Leptosia nina]|uniref:Uncharacterized protein n=1 Tax=Leptosia nina TaxID=320188 RepID=A0AAV1J062_9NEOP
MIITFVPSVGDLLDFYNCVKSSNRTEERSDADQWFREVGKDEEHLRGSKQRVEGPFKLLRFQYSRSGIEKVYLKGDRSNLALPLHLVNVLPHTQVGPTYRQTSVNGRLDPCAIAIRQKVVRSEGIGTPSIIKPSSLGTRRIEKPPIGRQLGYCGTSIIIDTLESIEIFNLGLWYASKIKKGNKTTRLLIRGTCIGMQPRAIAREAANGHLRLGYLTSTAPYLLRRRNSAFSHFESRITKAEPLSIVPTAYRGIIIFRNVLFQL